MPVYVRQSYLFFPLSFGQFALQGGQLALSVSLNTIICGSLSTRCSSGVRVILRRINQRQCNTSSAMSEDAYLEFICPA